MDNSSKKKTKKKVLAWIVLIILIVIGIILTYLRFFATDVKLSEQPKEKTKTKSENKNGYSEGITSEESENKLLADLVTNFNSSFIVNNYKGQNILISSSLSKDDFIVNYNDSSKNYNKKFVCKYNGGILTADVALEDASYFDIVYRIIIYANQVITSQDDSVDNIISGVLNGTNTYSGLAKDIMGNTVTYSIDLLGTVGN